MQERDDSNGARSVYDNAVRVYRNQVPPSGSFVSGSSVGEITVICFFSAEGFIFQKPDGYLPAQAGSHILQAGQFSSKILRFNLIRSGGKWRIYRTFMCSGRNPGISKGKKIAGFGSSLTGSASRARVT